MAAATCVKCNQEDPVALLTNIHPGNGGDAPPHYLHPACAAELINSGVFDCTHCGGHIRGIVLPLTRQPKEALGQEVGRASYYLLESSLLDAILSGDFEELSKRLEGNGAGISLTEKTLFKCIRLAIDTDNLNILELLLHTDKPVYWGKAALYAAKTGHREILGWVLENGVIPQKHLEKAVDHSARNGYSGIVAILLRHSKLPMSKESLELAVIRATERSQKDTLVQLLDQGFISDAVFSAAIEITKKKGRPDIMLALNSHAQLQTP